MTVAETISQRLPDGGIEVWLDGWYVRFPPDDGRPTVERAPRPTSLHHPSLEMAAMPFASGYAVRHGSWIVAVTESDYTVIPADPDDSDTSRRYYRI